MKLKEVQRLELPPAADMHVHLRQGDMMELAVPQIRRGGVDTVFVMPNLTPPVTTVAQALEYKARLQAIEPNVTYLMSLYLHESITPEVIAEAAAAGITGVKVYPQGVTTNSESGVVSLDAFFAVFASMQQHDMVLNLHGEVPFAPSSAVTQEEAFLPTLERIHAAFPGLRIVLEHCTTRAAVESVRRCGRTVGATITAHHLYLTGDEAARDPFAFCKPIPKRGEDRDALLAVVCGGEPKFFFGSDSAPHPLVAKRTTDKDKVPAGVYTQPYATQLVLLALEDAVDRGVVAEAAVTPERLEGFLSRFGRRFYKLEERPDAEAVVVLERKGERIAERVVGPAEGGLEVGVSRAGDEVFSLRWGFVGGS